MRPIIITEEQWRIAEALTTSAGLEHERRGCCLWAWRVLDGKPCAGRYIDVLGLLDSPTPKHYALKCYWGGGA